jgi:hypothetical protein
LPFKGLFTDVIEKIGKNKIVAVTTDNAKNMMAALSILKKKYPWILFSGCQAHCIDLAAKDLCAEKGSKIPEITQLLASTC